MAALDIQPHSRRLSGMAVAGLTLLAAASFAAGLARQVMQGAAPSPFSAAAYGQTYAAVPEATPARDPRLAAAVGAPHRKAPPDPALLPDAAEAPPAIDAAATAPEPAAPDPAPPPAEAPPTP